MASQLEMEQTEQRKKMPRMECFRGGINSKVDGARPLEVFLEFIRADTRPVSELGTNTRLLTA